MEAIDYMFGFSRGAYTVRAVAALLHMYGLLPAGNEPLIRYAIRMMNAVPRRQDGKGFDGLLRPAPAQAYSAALNDAAMAQALAALKATTAEMKTVAAKMVSATTFIANAANLLTAANKAVSALK